MTTETLGRTFFFDSSVLGTDSAAWAALRTIADHGVIELRRASALDDDLARDRNAERRGALKSEAAYPSALGVFVIGESRLGAAVLGSDDESDLMRRLFAAIFPGTAPSSSSRTASNKRRDVMHLHTTKKYGADGFITRDGAILKKAEVLEVDFGIQVFTPEGALAFVRRLQARSDSRRLGHA